ncbi:uncharacterized protein [Euphorbia lathyris]|uniref:uncharacterized protein isoform X2 n=1 Tax=Euphorbia lathyris TaxID=212925 RepID=UPI00331388FA
MLLLRDLTQEWFVKNRTIAQSTFTKLTRRHEEALKQNYIVAEKFKVKESNERVFKVSFGKDDFVVDMGSNSCSCNHFQIDEIPCAHALAVACFKHMDPYQFCSQYFTKEAMLSTYDCSIFPVPKQESWDIPPIVKDVIVFPPFARNKASRPKKRRFRSAWESKTQNRCSRCGKKGHNRKTCSNAAKQAFLCNY